VTAPRGQRVLSIDIFRGLTMLVMIFVNDLASVKDLPWWTYHMPRGTNGMTYVDVVFPAFLFIVGMAIPLAVSRRLEKGDTQPQLWGHILLRFASLAILGIFIANWGKVDPALTGVSKTVWSLTGFAGAILLWNVYPRTPERQTVYRAMKCLGFVMLFAMLAIFRRTAKDGQVAWLDFGYWEILGLIAKTYLAVCILYVPLRKLRWAPVTLLAALCALNVASRVGWTPFLKGLPFWAWPFGRGDLASITMAGIVASQIFLDGSFAKTFKQRAAWAAGYAAALFAAGWMLLGFGVTKLGGTPAWCLWCAAISMALFLGLYWLVDVKGVSKWAGFVKPAGANTLLTYLLPDVFYAAFGVSWASAAFGAGWPGAARSLLFTALMLGAAGVLTRLRVRMQL
jgi:heparan-alpha-glucosaminide N-acetyltransferase